MITPRLVLPIGLILVAAACDPVGQPAPDRPATAAVEEGAPCADETHRAAPQPAATSGPGLAATEAVGGPVSDTVELVDAADIVADPTRFAGRTVRVAGRVKGFCHHARAWYAIDVPGAEPPYLRVVTAPDFLVPEGAMDTEATAVGTVEVQDTPAGQARHYEQEHRLGTAGDGGGGVEPGGRVPSAVLRATGAVFAPAG
jgi:hypothetical protein